MLRAAASEQPSVSALEAAYSAESGHDKDAARRVGFSTQGFQHSPDFWPKAFIKHGVGLIQNYDLQ